MAAAADVDCLVNLDDLDIDDDFDVVIQALDLDLSADDKFRGGACCSAIFSDADTVSHCRHACDGDGDGSAATAVVGWLLAGLGDDDDCGDGAEEEAGSSPAYSGVTDDGSLAPAAGDDAEAISAYVAELERFLLQDDDDDEQAEVDQGLLGVVDDYFAGDQLLATAEVVPAAAGRTDGEEEEENGDGGGDVLAAREDEQYSASRKRARNKIKGTAMLTPWGELEVMNNLTMTHLAQIQVPAAAPWPQALLLCSM